MIAKEFHHFIESMAFKGFIDEKDAFFLHRNIVPEGLICREEADLLIALDRAVKVKHATFCQALTGLVVNYVVWGERPTGRIDADKARWLVSSLQAGPARGATALRIAIEALREAHDADESLSSFILRRQALEAMAKALPKPVAWA